MCSSHQTGFSTSKFLTLLLVLIGIFFAFFYFKLSGKHIFPISTIKIASDFQKVPKLYFKKIIAQHIEKKNFITLNIASLKGKLMEVPWIYDVSIRREWPGTLLIKITEQKLAVLYNEKGAINQHGEIFFPPLSSVPRDFPKIVCNENDLKNMFEYYQQMREILLPIPLKIYLFQSSFDGSLKVTLTNGVVLLLGKTEIITRWKRFVTAYSKLIKEASISNKRLKQIDLRYPNGFAVKWLLNENKETKTEISNNSYDR